MPNPGIQALKLEFKQIRIQTCINPPFCSENDGIKINIGAFNSRISLFFQRLQRSDPTH